MPPFSKAFKQRYLYRAYNPKYHNFERTCGTGSVPYIFQSDDGGNNSIMQGKMPYVKCYSGINDGVLYPMEEGVLFFK